LILDKFKDFELIPKMVELIQTGPIISEDTIKSNDSFQITKVQTLIYNSLMLTKEGILYSCGKGGNEGSKLFNLIIKVVK
jgi:hypothetical protein